MYFGWLFLVGGLQLISLAILAHGADELGGSTENIPIDLLWTSECDVM